MPNTINATNPMPMNSTTSATESYSSQCRLRESIGAANPSERTAESASSIAYSTTPSIAVFWTEGARAAPKVRDYVPANCDVAHTLVSPSNSIRTGTRTCQEGTHGTETNIS